MDKSEKKSKAQAREAKAGSEQLAVPAQVPHPKQQAQQKPVKRKFEIAVYDVDEVFNEETGQVAGRNLKPVPADPMHPIIVEIGSKKEFEELAKTY